MCFIASESKLARSIWVFLALGWFAAEAAFDSYWILLDFLGFSRPNLDLSMGYTGFSLDEFSRALRLLDIRTAGRARGVSMRKAGLFMGRA
jgi:hypothetical protein